MGLVRKFFMPNSYVQSIFQIAVGSLTSQPTSVLSKSVIIPLTPLSTNLSKSI
jgi:hypothetical protein